MACPHSKKCALYEQFQIAGLAKFWIASYCDADHTRCIRFQLATAGKPVAANLLPNGKLMKPKVDVQ